MVHLTPIIKWLNHIYHLITHLYLFAKVSIFTQKTIDYHQFIYSTSRKPKYSDLVFGLERFLCDTLHSLGALL